ncbi:Lar family restriction alleviation protein [Neorhizobium galegae]|nr:Lar family restriction alleviation protein [Neorhizobium galegae]
MTDKLLPCPFCGTEPYFSQPVVGSKWFEVSCNGDDCGAMGPSLPDKREAAAAWNRRAVPATPPQNDVVDQLCRHERPKSEYQCDRNEADHHKDASEATATFTRKEHDVHSADNGEDEQKDIVPPVHMNPFWERLQPLHPRRIQRRRTLPPLLTT